MQIAFATAGQLRVFLEFLKKLYVNRFLIRSMAVRDLKALYIGSFFGFFWAILNPAAQLVIYGVVFGVFFRSTPDPAYGTSNYFLFLLCGLIPWQFFSQAISSSTSILIVNANLIKKAVGFPSEILPVVSILSNIISHFIGVALLLAILLLFTGKITLLAPAILLYLFWIAVFSLGLSWAFASINVYLRDVQYLVGLLMMGMMFFTPLFYPPSIVPAGFLPFLKLNPLYHMIEGYRLALLTGRMIPSQDLLYLALASVVSLSLGGLLFRVLKPGFADVL